MPKPRKVVYGIPLDPRENLEYYTKSALASGEWTDAEIRREYSRLRDIAQKRLQTLLPMIAEGGDVNVTTTETKGNTALHYACATGDVELVQWLIANGADTQAKTEAGKTPIDCIGGDKKAANELYLLLKGVTAPATE